MDARQRLLTVTFAVFCVSGAVVADDKLTFRCSFGPGASANWDSGSVSVLRGNFGSPNVSVTFDAIDLVAGTGRLIGNAGASDIVVLASGAGLTLIESTDTGNYVFTTIFADKAKASGEFIAVMSRHMSFDGRPFPSQYHGTCARF